MRVSVIGCGHLGIPHAAAMAELGHEVIGVDVDQAKVDRLNAGECPIYEIGLPELLSRHIQSGHLRFTTDIRQAANFAELHFIGVGTPIDSDGRSYDTAQVFGAIRQLAPHLDRACTIVGKSTVTVGTTTQVTALAQRLAPAGDRVDVVWNPEFLREGHAVEDTLRPDRLIAGVSTAEGEKAIRAVYAGIIDAGVPIFVTDPQTAELAKGAANTFLGLKISYINAVADMCEAADGDISQIVDILGIDPRIGAEGMRPGIGYGGGCLPKDVRAFTASARQLGAEQAATLLRAAEEINNNRTDVALGLITRALGDRPSRAPGSPCGVPRSSPAPTTCASPRPSPSPSPSSRPAPSSPCTTRRPCPPRWSATRSWFTPTTCPPRSMAPSYGPSHRVARVPAGRPPCLGGPPDQGPARRLPHHPRSRSLALGGLDRPPARSSGEVEAAYAPWPPTTLLRITPQWSELPGLRGLCWRGRMPIP